MSAVVRTAWREHGARLVILATRPTDRANTGTGQGQDGRLTVAPVREGTVAKHQGHGPSRRP